MIKLSLKVKLIISITTIIVIFGMITTYGVFSFARNEFIEIEKEHLRLLATQESSELYQIFNQGRILSEYIAKDPSIRDYFNDDEESKDSHILEHLNILNVGDRYSAIYLMDKEGLTLVSTEPSFVGNNYSFRDYFKNAINGNAGVYVAIGVTSGEPGYYFSYPIEVDDEVVGVAVAKMRPEFLHAVIKDFKLAEDANVLFVDERGVVLFSSDSTKIYNSLAPLSIEEEKSIEDRRIFEGVEITPLDYDEVKEVINNFTEVITIEFHDELDGRPEVIAIEQIDDLSFFVIIEEDAQVFNTLASNISMFISILVLLAALFAAIAILILIIKFLKPLEDLKKGVKELSSGKFGYRIDINTNDELQDVADEFNKMAKKLEKSRKNIEKKVEERTEKLEKLTNFMSGREIKMIELKKQIKELKKENNEN